VLCHHSSDFSVCYTFVLKFYLITQQFLLIGVQGLVLSLVIGYPRCATDTHTTGFWKVCNYKNQSLPAVYQESRKVLFPKESSESAGFSARNMFNAKVGICEYLLVIYRYSRLYLVVLSNKDRKRFLWKFKLKYASKCGILIKKLQKLPCFPLWIHKIPPRLLVISIRV